MKRQNLIFAALLVSGVIIVVLLVHDRPASSIQQTADADSEASSSIVAVNLEAQQNVRMSVVEVGEQTIRGILKTTGVVSPDQNRIAHLRPLARGVVENIYVQLGDRVRKDQSLLVYDNIELGDLIGEYLNLLGGLEKLEAGREVAKKFLDRAESLIEVEAIAQREYELRQAEYQQALAQVESQKAELSRVEEKLHRFGLSENNIGALSKSGGGIHRTASHNTMRAPFTGVITKFDVSPGELVDRERELFTLVDTSSVWVLADVYEKDIGSIGTSGECLATVPSYPSEVFAGEILYVSDFLDPTSRTAKVRCVVPNRDGRLKLEMFASVDIPTIQGWTTVAVPTAALQQIDQDTVVFVQQDATHFEKRVVQIGERGKEWAQVVAGIHEGEKVVGTGSFYLKSIFLRELIGGEE